MTKRKVEEQATPLEQDELQRTAKVAKFKHVDIKAGGFTRKRTLTLEVRSISKIEHIIFRCESELVTSEMPSKFSKNGKAEAISVDVTDAMTGEMFTLVLNAVAASSLKRAGSPLIGRHFEIEVHGVREGKRYRDTEVHELEEGE